jgi:predicted Zn-dependent peptidase
MRVLVEKVPHSRSVSVGLWVSVGSRDDFSSQSGIAHLVEHMVFKGTPSRTSDQISRQIDAIGGQINGGTGKEYTFYYAQAPLTGLEQVLDIISDIAQNPEFSAQELKRERQVVLEELRAKENDPEQQAHDLFIANLWQDHHPLTRCVLGKPQTVEAICRKDLVGFHSKYYHPQAMTLVVCGAAKKSDVINLASKLFKKSSTSLSKPVRNPPCLRSKREYYEKDIGQSHIFIGLPAPNAKSEDRFHAEVVNTILGGGTSSRLFTRIREQLGLAYSVSSYIVNHSDSGVWITYAGIAPRNAKQTLDVLLEELEALRTNVNKEELNLAKAKMRGNLILNLESNTNRMVRLGGALVVGAKILSYDQLIQRIDAVGLDDVHRIIDSYLDANEMNIAIVGPQNTGLQPEIELSKTLR